jgi:hypothetical protein
VNYSLSELSLDQKSFHSKFQQDYFIVGRNGITDYGMYMQALRELFSRVTTLRTELFEIERTRIRIAKAQAVVDDLSVNVYDRDLAAIDVREMSIGLPGRLVFTLKRAF